MGAPTLVSTGITSIQLSDATSSMTESSIGGGVATAAQEFTASTTTRRVTAVTQLAADGVALQNFNLKLMRSRAVGIDKRQNGFVNLNIFQFVLLNFFKAIIG